MKKILLTLGVILLFGACQTEQIEDNQMIIPQEKAQDLKAQVLKDDGKHKILKYANGVIEETFYDDYEIEVAEAAKTSLARETTDYIVDASVSPSITVGTHKEVVVITGGPFPAERGYVGFGNGQRKVYREIVYWSTNRIEVIVPAGAYSGVVNIYDSADLNTVVAKTTNSLTVKYGIYAANIYDSAANTVTWERIAFDGPEMVWHPEIGQYNQSILDLVQQAFDAWTTESGMNWRIGEPVAIDANSSASDGNFVFGFGPSPGAAHNSMAYTPCGDGTFKITGGRVVFDEKRDWVAALHEFGHAIGLPHTNNSGSCMVTTGGKNISTWDAEGATDKVTWSVANTPSCATPFQTGTVLPTYTYYQDNDGDGYGNSSVSVQAQTAPDGYVLDGGDCNDNDPTINPGAYDIPDNGIDEDCSGSDSVTPTYTFYFDGDNDSYGVDDNTITSTNPTRPAGYATRGADCNDNDPTIHPNATEILDNGIDEDCNGSDLTSDSFVNGISVPSTFSNGKLKIVITGNFTIDRVDVVHVDGYSFSQVGYESGQFFINFDRNAPVGDYTLTFHVRTPDITVDKFTTKTTKGKGGKNR